MHEGILVEFQVINICGVENESPYSISKYLRVKFQVEPGQALRSPVEGEKCPRWEIRAEHSPSSRWLQEQSLGQGLLLLSI